MGSCAEEPNQELPKGCQSNLWPRRNDPVQFALVSLQRVPINNFRGGLNTRDSPFELQPNESPDLRNVTLTALVGVLQVRAGITLYENVASVADNCKQATVGASRFLMASLNGTIVAIDSGGTIHTLFAGTAGTVWDFSQMPDASGNDKVWCVNGVDAPQKWDGVAVSTSAWAGGITSGNGNRMIVWKSKMVLVGSSVTPNRIFFSKVGDPEQTTGTFDFVDLRGDDDEIDFCTECNVLADRLYIFKRRSVWLFTDPSTFANRRVGEPGCTARFQSDVCEEKLYFFNEQGLWSTAGVTLAYESGSINSYFANHLNVGAISKARILATRDTYPRVLLSIPVDASPTNNMLIEVVPHINFRRIGGRRYLLLPAFLLHTLNLASLANLKNSAGFWGIVGGHASLSKIYNIFSGTTDDGATINAYWKSAWMAIQGEEPFERIRRANVELSGDAILDVFKDFSMTPDFSATLPNPNNSAADTIWDNGSHIWDDGGVWDAPGQYRFSRVRPESRGRFHQIQFRSLPGGVPFLINTAEIVVRGGKEH